MDTVLDPSTGTMVSNRKTADPTYQVSPRLGVAFPISEQGVMRFKLGYFSNPATNLLYTNNEFERAKADRYTIGNANLEPERTLQFEVGLQQGLSETMGMDLTVFSKDIGNSQGKQQFEEVLSSVKGLKTLIMAL